MKRRLAALLLFLAVAFAPQAFADDRFESLRELLSNPNNYLDDKTKARIQVDDAQHEQQKDRTPQQKSDGNLDVPKQEINMTLHTPVRGTSPSAHRTHYSPSR